MDNHFNSLTDEVLELIDPTPHIHTLFVQFNARFFWNTLGSVEVKWSNRMTSCVGVCRFHPRNKQCVIALSAPLLKLRPRKDLVETLLHEMIHAFLFLTNNDRDRDGHGPNFCMHMRRINSEAGTNITIYHNFHNEVKLYQQHWWKCNGPCQYRPPFFGMVRRALNRPPGRLDFWWTDHQQNCNGQFIKIKEPENYKSGSKKNDIKSKPNSKTNDKSKLNRDITDWFTKKTLPRITSKSTHQTAHSSKIFNQSNNDNDKSSTSKDNNDANSSRVMNNLYPRSPLMDLSRFASTTHSAIRNVKESSERVEKNGKDNIASKSSKFSCSGVSGGSYNGRSNLLTKFQHLSNDSSRLLASRESTSIASSSESLSIVNRSANNSNPNQQRTDVVFCPACDVPISLGNIYRHIDTCLIHDNSSLIDEINNNIDNNNGFELILPRLPRRLSMERGNDEADVILSKRRRLHESSDTGHVSCPICNNMFPFADINQHVDECLEKSDKAREIDIPSTSHIANNNSIISINSSYNSNLDDSIKSSSAQPSTSTNVSRSNAAGDKRKCLVCNATLAAEVSLSDHLEECIGNMFDNTIVINDDGNDDDIVSVKDDSVENKYPCPVCMQIIPENLMNQHLDMCLKDG